MNTESWGILGQNVTLVDVGRSYIHLVHSIQWYSSRSVSEHYIPGLGCCSQSSRTLTATRELLNVVMLLFPIGCCIITRVWSHLGVVDLSKVKCLYCLSQMHKCDAYELHSR